MSSQCPPECPAQHPQSSSQNPQYYPPQQCPPQQVSQQYPSQQYPSQQYPSQQHPPQQYLPPQYPPQQYPSPQQYPPQYFPPQQNFPPQNTPPQQEAPEQMEHPLQPSSSLSSYSRTGAPPSLPPSLPSNPPSASSSSSSSSSPSSSPSSSSPSSSPSPSPSPSPLYSSSAPPSFMSTDTITHTRRAPLPPETPEERKKRNEKKREEEKKKEEEALKQAEEMGKAYFRIMSDPRYHRLAAKYCPNLFSVQMVKNVVVDPAFIPVLGLVVKMYRSAKIEKYKSTFSKSQEELTNSQTPQTSSSLQFRSLSSSGSITPPKEVDTSKEESEKDSPLTETSIDNMKVSLQAEAKVRHVALGVDCLFTLLPIIGLLPSSGAGSYASTAAKMGLKASGKQVARRAEMSKVDKELIEAEIFRRYDVTKAFLIYLGERRTVDELYKKWEADRIFLKSIFGAHPDEHLPILRPNRQELALLQQMEKNKRYIMGKFASMGKSTLWLLWRVYECWDQLYYDRLSEYAGSLADSKQGYAEKERQFLYTADLQFVTSHLHPFVSNIRRLEPIEARKAAELLILRYETHPHYREWMHFARDEEKTFQAGVALLEPLLEFFFEKQEVWGIENSTTREIEAVCLFERGHGADVKGVIVSHARSLTSAYGLSRFHKLCRTRASIFRTREHYMTKVFKKKETRNWIHLVGFNPSADLKVFEEMMWAMRRLDPYHSTTTCEYVLLQKEVRDVLTRTGFERVDVEAVVEVLEAPPVAFPPSDTEQSELKENYPSSVFGYQQFFTFEEECQKCLKLKDPK